MKMGFLAARGARLGRVVLVGAFALALALLPETPAVAQEASTPPVADHELLSRLAEEGRVSADLAQPGVTEYLQSLGRRGMRALIDALTPLLGSGAGAVAVVTWITYALLVLIGIVAVGLLLWAVIAIFFRGAGWHEGEPVEDGAAIPVTAPRDAEGWWRELQSCLNRNDPRGALEALGWWLGRSLAPAAVEGSWTLPELLRRVRRSDLLARVLRIERLRFGPEAPKTEEVRAAAEDLRPRIASTVAEAVP